MAEGEGEQQWLNGKNPHMHHQEEPHQHSRGNIIEFNGGHCNPVLINDSSPLHSTLGKCPLDCHFPRDAQWRAFRSSDATRGNIKECEKCRIWGQRNHGIYLTNRKHGDYWHLIATGVSFPVTLQRYLSLRVPTNVTTTQQGKTKSGPEEEMLVLYYLPHHSSRCRPFPVKPNRELQ